MNSPHKKATPNPVANTGEETHYPLPKNNYTHAVEKVLQLNVVI